MYNVKLTRQSVGREVVSRHLEAGVDIAAGLLLQMLPGGRRVLPAVHEAGQRHLAQVVSVTLSCHRVLGLHAALTSAHAEIFGRLGEKCYRSKVSWVSFVTRFSLRLVSR